MKIKLHFVLLLLLHGYLIFVTPLTILIRNQHEANSRRKAEDMQTRLLEEAKHITNLTLSVLMLHEEWAPANAWTILPIFGYLYDKYRKTSKWVFFCEDTTEINLAGLVDLLSEYNSKENHFLGYALHDTEPSIIHHYAFHNDPSSFKFPDFDAGWALSMPLVKSAAKRLEKNPPGMNFNIDVKHEIAMFLHEEGKGTPLTHVGSFCINKGLSEGCVSTVRHEEPNCDVVHDDEVLVAVKTCEKFHTERLPILQRTSGVHVKHIRYYSDVADASIPTEYIGVNNTESGHCAKLKTIINIFKDNEWKRFKWFVVIDDDTIMNFRRLQKMLACYDPFEPLMIGERYGYGINYNPWGYSYPTGGGGMILSAAAVEKISSNDKCHCHAPDAPDDMWLGSCFKKLNIPMVHSNSFHQSYPSQYSKDFLSHRYLVSFHKHKYENPDGIFVNYLGGESTHYKREL